MLVAGLDSSTQSCKVVVHDADTGSVVRSGSAPHPAGTSADPEAWWFAFQRAGAEAGGFADVSAISVAAQQHGMVCLDESGGVVRDALLWNDTRSAAAADQLTAELGGSAAWAEAVGSVPLAAFTVAKLRWLAEHEPANAARTTAVCLPHDWLTWRLRGVADQALLTTDRSDASGTGYWSPLEGRYREDLLRLAMNATPQLPTVLPPSAVAGESTEGLAVGAGSGDNAGAAFGLGAEPGDVIVSIGTSSVASTVSAQPTADASAAVAGFADATGRFLPLVCMLNGSQTLEAVAALLDVPVGSVSDLALTAPSGSDGLVLVPYLQGERTPNLPHATGAIHGLTLRNSTRANLARAAVEGLLCGVADGIDALRAAGAPVRRVLLVGGSARAEAVRRIAPAVLGLPVLAPRPAEYVAAGAARQAAWASSGEAEPPDWPQPPAENYDADHQPDIRSRFREASTLIVEKVARG